MQTPRELSSVLAEAKSIVGSDNYLDEFAERQYFSQDYYRKAEPVSAIIQPVSVDALAAAVPALTRAGVALYPRGGGYSYTDAYLPTKLPGVTVDISRLNRILEVNQQDMYVTAEAGCTWAQLEEHLKPFGLRTPFWGPLSGLNATLGGGISQGSVSLGSGKYGPSAESVISMDVVIADGTIVSTGSAGQKRHSPFFRHYGPDFTGLFCNDAGALGIKARVTLRLMKRRPLVHGVSFGFDSFHSMSKAMAAVSGLGTATEATGMTREAALRASRTGGVFDDLKILLQVGRSGPGWVGGTSRMIKMALAGRRYFGASPATAKFVVEGFNREELRGQLKAIRQSLADLGVETPNTIPTVMRARPFADHDMVNPDGRRQLPLHAILPYSRSCEFNDNYQALLARYAAPMKEHSVDTISVCASISTNGLLIEPVLMWPDVLEEFHRRNSSDATIARVKTTEPNIGARELVAELRSEIIEMMYHSGGVHLQIGKAYPYLRERDGSQVRALQQLKSLFDPQGLINPGALGLPYTE
jgi:FAD/FMN-containing dehydrogenase